MREDDWQRVLTAFKQGMDKDRIDPWTKMFGTAGRDEQLIKELTRVKKALDQCSPRTLELLDKGITLMGMLPWADPKRGLVTCHVAEAIDLAWRPPEKVGRRPIPKSCKMAVAVLSSLYDGDHPKVRGAKANLTKSRKGNYAFNPYITWLGQQLMRIELEVLHKGERRMSLEEACLAAWNATPPRRRKFDR